MIASKLIANGSDKNYGARISAEYADAENAPTPGKIKREVLRPPYGHYSSLGPY